MADARWLVSGWDHNVHVFDLPLGEVASAAACTHSALTSGLRTPTGRETLCPGCVRLRGHQLSQLAGPQVHERDRYAT